MKSIGSWKTSAAGVLGAIGIIATQLSYVFDTDPNTTFSVEAFIGAFALIGIGWFARDNNVSSEQAGAK